MDVPGQRWVGAHGIPAISGGHGGEDPDGELLERLFVGCGLSAFSDGHADRGSVSGPQVMRAGGSAPV